MVVAAAGKMVHGLQMRVWGWALLIFVGIVSAQAGEVHIDTATAALVYDEAGVAFAPKCFAKGWIRTQSVSKPEVWEFGATTVPFTLKANQPDGGTFDGAATFSLIPEGKVSAFWSLTPDRDLEIEQLHIGTTLEMATYAGGTYVIDGNAAKFPEAEKTFQFGEAKAARRLEVRDAKGVRGFTLDFDRPIRLSFQDNSKFKSATYDLRLDLGANKIRAGELRSLGVTLSGPAALTLKIRQPVTIAASADWVPVTIKPFIEPGSALDFSSFRGTTGRAGDLGRIVARGDHFEFERQPGVTQRFYGVNLCFSANYVEKASADRLAAHLARMGYNAVRFHHHDNGLCAEKERTQLDPMKAKMFDGLVAACIENGIYMTTDLFVSRRVPWKDIGEDRAGVVEMQEFKELVQAHEGAFQNYLAFARSFLTHVNVYTGRRNADEPALAWLSFVNEGNLGNRNMTYMARHPCFVEKYAAWLHEKKATKSGIWDRAAGKLPKSLYDTTDPEVPVYELFLQDLESRFAARVTKFLREEMKSRQLTTNMNCWRYPATLQLPRAADYDYVDDHFYVDHPRFLYRDWRLPSRCPNVNPIAKRSLGVPELAIRRILDRPFTITEYNYSAPGRYRGVGGIVCGAIGALQGWAGLWRFDWSSDALGVETPERKQIGYFDISGDPLSLASERASICLYLRRDLEELSPIYGMTLPPEELKSPTGPIAQMACGWNWAGWYAKIGNVVADRMPPHWRSAGVYRKALAKDDAEVRADLAGLKMGNGMVSVDEKGTFAIRTARTCGVFGEPGTYEADALACTIARTPATLWVSSLDANPIRSAKRLLLTHLTDVQNTGCRYADNDLTVLLDWGHLPHLMRTGQAEVKLRLAGSAYAVYVLDTDGKRRREVSSTFSEGCLHFTADVAFDRFEASYLYEIVRLD